MHTELYDHLFTIISLSRNAAARHADNPDTLEYLDVVSRTAQRLADAQITDLTVNELHTYSHDLRTPLTLLVGYSALVSSDESELYEHCRAVQYIVGDIIDFGQHEALLGEGLSGATVKKTFVNFSECVAAYLGIPTDQKLIVVHINKGWLELILRGLRRAVQFVTWGGYVTLSDSSGGAVSLTVAAHDRPPTPGHELDAILIGRCLYVAESLAVQANGELLTAPTENGIEFVLTLPTASP